MDIKLAVAQNKSLPSHTTKTNLLALRQELRAILLDEFEKHHCRLKAKHHATNNKAGKNMALCVHRLRTKSKIHYVIHPLTKDKLQDPQAIANAFRCYYEHLYTIKENL